MILAEDYVPGHTKELTMQERQKRQQGTDGAQCKIADLVLGGTLNSISLATGGNSSGVCMEPGQVVDVVGGKEFVKFLFRLTPPTQKNIHKSHH